MQTMSDDGDKEAVEVPSADILKITVTTESEPRSVGLENAADTKDNRIAVMLDGNAITIRPSSPSLVSHALASPSNKVPEFTLQKHASRKRRNTIGSKFNPDDANLLPIDDANAGTYGENNESDAFPSPNTDSTSIMQISPPAPHIEISAEETRPRDSDAESLVSPSNINSERLSVNDSISRQVSKEYTEEDASELDDLVAAMQDSKLQVPPLVDDASFAYFRKTDSRPKRERSLLHALHLKHRNASDDSIIDTTAAEMSLDPNISAGWFK